MEKLLVVPIAQVINNPALGNLGRLSGEEFFAKLIPALIGLGFVVGAIIFVFMLVYGAILWISSGGDKMRMESARSKIANALIGIVILFGFFAILNLVSCFFGIGIGRISVGEFNITFSGAICPGNWGGGRNGRGGEEPPPPQCQPTCQRGYFCSTVGSISQCCRCVNGNDPDGFGPVRCCTPPGPSSGSCNIYNVNGCAP